MSAVLEAERSHLPGLLEAIRRRRTTRNLAAHDYEINFTDIAEHYDSLHALAPSRYGDAGRFVGYCE